MSDTINNKIIDALTGVDPPRAVASVCAHRATDPTLGTPAAVFAGWGAITIVLDAYARGKAATDG